MFNPQTQRIVIGTSNNGGGAMIVTVVSIVNEADSTVEKQLFLQMTYSVNNYEKDMIVLESSLNKTQCDLVPFTAAFMTRTKTLGDSRKLQLVSKYNVTSGVMSTVKFDGNTLGTIELNEDGTHTFVSANAARKTYGSTGSATYDPSIETLVVASSTAEQQVNNGLVVSIVNESNGSVSHQFVYEFNHWDGEKVKFELEESMLFYYRYTDHIVAFNALTIEMDGARNIYAYIKHASNSADTEIAKVLNGSNVEVFSVRRDTDAYEYYLLPSMNGYSVIADTKEGKIGFNS